MKLVSWNCQKGLNSKDKARKLFELCPDIAIIQESFHPNEFNEDIRYEEAIWIGEEKPKGLGICVLSLSKDYHLTQLVDQVKYDWVVPIKVTGKENFTLIAVWTKRSSGTSYGSILYHALQEYESLIQDGPVVIMGDFNLDKRVASSYSGVGGFKKMMGIFENYGLKSIYHINNTEEFGSESVPTYYHYGKSDRPFHLDYCFVSEGIWQGMSQFEIGTSDEYLPFSDHVPLVFEFTLGLNTTSVDQGIHSSTSKGVIGKNLKEPFELEKTMITPEILTQDYLLNIDSQIATSEEISEAIKYIRAQRIMKGSEAT
jgi:exodeoxyribonuclease III